MQASTHIHTSQAVTKYLFSGEPFGFKISTREGRTARKNIFTATTKMLVLYGMPGSPPCRIVSLALDVLEVEYEYKNVDLMAGESRTPEFLKVWLNISAFVWQYSQFDLQK